MVNFPIGKNYNLIFLTVFQWGFSGAKKLYWTKLFWDRKMAGILINFLNFYLLSFFFQSF